MATQTMSTISGGQTSAGDSSRNRHDFSALSNQRPRALSDSSPRAAASHVGMIRILSFSPAEGGQSIPITVSFNCAGNLGTGVYIRLCFGRRALSTKVRELDPPGFGRWQLEAAAPSLSKQNSSSTKIPLTVQAVNKENGILDSVTFADFTYLESDVRIDQLNPTYSAEFVPRSLQTTSKLSVRLVSGPEQHCRSFHRAGPYDRPRTPISPTDSEHASSSRSRISAHSRSHALRRTRQAFEVTEANTQNAILQIMNPLDDFCYNWDDSELKAGRRLVRFHRMQDGNKLMISADHISQEQYDENDIVVSCIYRDETDACCVTSVDIIHLLQRLVDADFEVDEKNRIRRNLEGLRPTTVSKSKPGSEGFFQRIMDFPDPKPRKIEKDLKVFDWKLMPQALEKIISKYSLYTSPVGTPKEETPTPSQPHCTTREMPETKLKLEEAPAQFLTSYGEILAGDASHDLGESSFATEPLVSQFEHHSPTAEFDSHSPTSQFQQNIQPPLFEPILQQKSSVGINGENTLYEIPPEQYQNPYVDSAAINRYYTASNGDVLYAAVDDNISPCDETAYPTPIHLTATSVPSFGSEPIPTSSWVLQQAEECSPGGGYEYEAATYDITAFHSFDSLDFQTLREHNINAALTGQVV